MNTTAILTASSPDGDRPESTMSAVQGIERLRDGARVVIRQIRPGDLELERRFIAELSPRSRRFRFLSSMSTPSEALLKKMTVLDPATDVAYVALIDPGEGEREIGVARFSAANGAIDCEFAVTVANEWQRKGLGTLLMKYLLDAARTRGIHTMHSSDLRDNDLMRGFAGRLGFGHRPDPDDATQVLYSLSSSAA